MLKSVVLRRIKIWKTSAKWRLVKDKRSSFKFFAVSIIKTLIFCNEFSSHMPSNLIYLVLFLPPPLVQFLCLISEDLSKISISHIQSWSSNSTSRWWHRRFGNIDYKCCFIDFISYILSPQIKIFASVAALPPVEKVNSSCVAPSLTSSAQLTCNGSQDCI